MKKKHFFKKIRLDAVMLSVCLTVSSVLLVFSGGQFFIDFTSVGFSIAAGTGNVVYSCSSFITGTITSVRELAQLRKKYHTLTEQLKDYEFLQRSNADIRRENKELKKLLGLADKLKTRNIPAQIIGFDADNLYSGIILDKGTSNGIRKDMPVLAFQGNNFGVVGRIVRTGRHSSLILPLYDYQCHAASKLQRSKYRGLISGQGSPDKSLIMKYVQKHAKNEISIGDMVVTTGNNRIFPANAPVGVVKAMRTHDYETYLELNIDPIIDFSCLDYVFVLDITHPEKEVF